VRCTQTGQSLGTRRNHSPFCRPFAGTGHGKTGTAVSKSFLPLLESAVLYFCPPTDGKGVHLAYDEFNKINYIQEVHSAIGHILSSMRTRMQKEADLQDRYSRIYSPCKM
jgi:hypothetical protein